MGRQMVTGLEHYKLGHSEMSGMWFFTFQSRHWLQECHFHLVVADLPAEMVFRSLSWTWTYKQDRKIIHSVFQESGFGFQRSSLLPEGPLSEKTSTTVVLLEIPREPPLPLEPPLGSVLDILAFEGTLFMVDRVWVVKIRVKRGRWLEA